MQTTQATQAIHAREIHTMDNFQKYEIIESMFLSAWNQAEMIFSQARKPENKPALSFCNKATGAAGTYYSKTKTVEINIAYLCEKNREHMQTTIVHEICHHLQTIVYRSFQQWHGPEFRNIMQLMGEQGKTYHRMNVREAKQRVKANKIAESNGVDLLASFDI